MRKRFIAILVAAAGTAPAWSECPSINFDNLAVGTVVTSQPGVTFSVLPQSCGGSTMLYMKVVIATGGTSSGTHALSIDTGCPDFSPDYLRMTFANLQREVTFVVGEASGGAGYDFDIRYYNDAGGLLGTQHLESAAGVHRFVRVGSAGGAQNIRRIEVDSTIDGFESIDDLKLEADLTPPEARIDTPLYQACACGTLALSGMACDSDGNYGSDRLEYLPVDAAAGTPWTLVATATTPQCSGGILYSWNTSALSHGLYYARLTATNACGVSASDVAVVYVDRVFDILSLRSPTSGMVIGGTVCLDGTVWDHLCFDQYVAEYQSTGGGAWQVVDPNHPVYTSIVTTDPIASWATGAPLAPDGSYNLRITALDDCSNSSVLQRTVQIDNTPPTAVISSPVACTTVNGSVEVRGTVTDLHLTDWSLEYASESSHGWTAIATGHGPVNNSTLGYWDTTKLPDCGYALRLVAVDSAIRDCNSTQHNRTEHLLNLLVLNCPEDLNHDGTIALDDLAQLLSQYGVKCP